MSSVPGDIQQSDVHTDGVQTQHIYDQLRQGHDVGGDSVDRVRKLEKLHGITPEQVQTYAAAIGLKTLPRDMNGRINLVDAFCGTGYAAKIAVRQALSFGIPLDIHLYDVNPAMLIVAKKEIEEMANGFGMSKYEGDGKRFINVITNQADLADPNVQLPKESHGILAKMGFHEIPKGAQADLMLKMKQSLTPGGRLAIWEVFAPDDPEIRFGEVIRVKDTLSGRSQLAENRDFLREQEFISILSDSSFAGNIRITRSWPRSWSTIDRYLHELGAQDIGQLAELNRAVAENVKPDSRYETQHDLLNGFTFDIPNSIIVATAA